MKTGFVDLAMLFCSDCGGSKVKLPWLSLSMVRSLGPVNLKKEFRIKMSPLTQNPSKESELWAV